MANQMAVRNLPALLVLSLLWGCSNAADEPPAADADPAQKFADFAACKLASGAVLAPCRVGYRTFGTLNDDHSNAVLVPTWYGGNSAGHAFLASPNIVSPEHFFVVIVDALGNGVSTSPSNSATQADDSFPQITIADMVDSQHRLLTEVLDIQSLHSVVGLSMGGMQAFEWAVRYPGFATRTVAGIGTPRLPSFDIALWTTRNRALELYRQCQCKEPLEILAGLWMLGSVPAKLESEVPREETVAAIASQAAARSMTIGQTWDQERQAEAMISHNIARDFDNDMARAAAHTETDFLIIVGDDDRVVTPGPARAFAKLVDATLFEMDEDCGHSDPSCAPDKFAGAVSTFINQEH